jgi:hypothetical protein
MPQRALIPQSSTKIKKDKQLQSQQSRDLDSILLDPQNKTGRNSKLKILNDAAKKKFLTSNLETIESDLAFSYQTKREPPMRSDPPSPSTA